MGGDDDVSISGLDRAHACGHASGTTLDERASERGDDEQASIGRAPPYGGVPGRFGESKRRRQLDREEGFPVRAVGHDLRGEVGGRLERRWTVERGTDRDRRLELALLGLRVAWGRLGAAPAAGAEAQEERRR